MKKLLFFLLFTTTLFAQDFAKDTLFTGTQPASIVKLKTHKIFILQNKNLHTPYIKQKDGSFISNGVPQVQIFIDKNKFTLMSTYDYVDVLFEKLDAGKEPSTNEFININNIKTLVHVVKHEKDKKLQIFVYYPLQDRFLNIDFIVNYKDEKDKDLKEDTIKDIIKNGIIVLENYYLKLKK